MSKSIRASGGFMFYQKPIHILAIIFSIGFCFPVQAQSSSDTSAPRTGKEKIQWGTASWYSDKFQGRRTANGEIFDQKKFTAAHNKLPFGTWVKVTNLRNMRSVYVRINDRLHYRNKRVVDMSRIAAEKLGMVKSGLARVKVEVLGKEKPPGAE